MNGIHLSLVGLNISIVGGFWIVITEFTVAAFTPLHHILLWGGLVLTLVSLVLPSQSGTGEEFPG